MSTTIKVGKSLVNYCYEISSDGRLATESATVFSPEFGRIKMLNRASMNRGPRYVWLQATDCAAILTDAQMKQARRAASIAAEKS